MVPAHGGGGAGAGGAEPSCPGVDKSADPANCGACTNRCSPAEWCIQGKCACKPRLPLRHFSSDVVPLFSGCAKGLCHGSSAPLGMVLTPDGAYQHLVGQPAVGCEYGRNRVEPGGPSKSYLVDKMMGARLCGGTPMPPSKGSSLERIAVVSEWICAGALDD